MASHQQVQTPRKATIAEAMKVEKLDSHTYRIHLDPGFCIGNVPNGGYTGTCLLAVANAHLSPRGQPDALTAHWEFPRRTSPGPAIVTVEEIKLGEQLSTLHLTLWQGGLVPAAPWTTPNVSRRIVLAYVNQTNLRKSGGITMRTGFQSTPAALNPPRPDLDALKANPAADHGDWKLFTIPQRAQGLAGHMENWTYFLPSRGPLTPGVFDMWTRMASGERITQVALGYVADSFPHAVHDFLMAPDLLELLDASRKGGAAAKTAEAEKIKAYSGLGTSMWFPTIVMNLEVKKALPEEGVEWLAVRATSKQIKDGRFDFDVTIRDVDGDLVALSHHSSMILSMERNQAKSKSSL